MHHAPKKDNGKLIALCLPLIILSFILFFLSNLLPYKGLWQAAGGILLVIFLFLNLRFALALYRYQVDGTSLMVFRKQGKREEKLCDIELSSALALYNDEEYKTKKPKYELCYNFCQSFASSNRAYFLFTFNDVQEKRALVIFEPSEEMKNYIKTFIKE
ncbi:MAG: hypothetical protein IKT43_04765 [Clostridia bacterium]|nr:hypothetical protein [Clostridia bacterium]